MRDPVDASVSTIEPTDIPEAARESVAHPFRFTGGASEYFRIWIVNVALTILTLGIYSAWAKVRTTSYFYRHTWLDGASFEYLGDPRKILKGRVLVATALIAVTVSEKISIALYLAFVVLLLLATPWVIVKAMRFKARNSTWRNVRFSFRGTTKEAFIEYFKGLLIAVVTLGIGAAWMQWNITRFVFDNATFGQLPMRFRTKALAFLGAFWRAGLLAGLIAAVLSFGTAVFARVSSASPEPMVLATTLSIGVAYLIMFTYLKARLANLVWGGVEIGEHRLESTQRFRDVLWLQATNLLGIVCTLGLAIPWAKVRNHRYRIEQLTLHAARSLVVEAAAAQEDDGAFGDALTDMGDFDIGFG